MSVAAKVVSSPPPAADAIRVMVVDDSVVVRGLVTRWLGEESNISVVASARTGRDAVDQVERANPDVVILDIEMPELDGISALPLLLAKKRDLVVIMASTLTLRNAEISLKALALGASDYLPKPESNRGVTTSTEFRRELIEKVTTLGAKRLKRRLRQTVAGPASAPPAALRTARASPPPGGATALSSAAPERKAAVVDAVPVLTPGAPIVLRPGMVKNPRVLLVGSSTGGPQALTALMSTIGSVIDRVPVMIVQHMPATFTTILAEHLARASGRVVREPKDGEPIVPGVVHLAPGGRHMLAVRRDGNPVVRLDDGPPVNFCRPAVDCLFRSAVSIWGGSALAVILTGMGHDGTQGARELVSVGASVLAQDEATSVVWGMPGTVAQAGLCSAVLPIEQIGPKVVRIFSGDVS